MKPNSNSPFDLNLYSPVKPSESGYKRGHGLLRFRKLETPRKAEAKIKAWLKAEAGICAHAEYVECVFRLDAEFSTLDTARPVDLVISIRGGTECAIVDLYAIQYPCFRKKQERKEQHLLVAKFTNSEPRLHFISALTDACQLD